MTKENGVLFSKKVGIVAGAVLAVIALSNTLGGMAVKLLVIPEIERVVKEERAARTTADSLISLALGEQIRALARDRALILQAMEERDQKQRIQMLRVIRNQSNKEQP